jgi:hypothetical protein
MNTTFLLVLLVLGDGGQMNASFVNTDSLNTCQNKSQTLDAILSTSNFEIIENRCVSSKIIFSKFEHSEKKKAAYYNYFVSMIDENLLIKRSEDQVECLAEKEKLALANNGNVYCVTSSQKMTE